MLGRIKNAKPEEEITVTAGTETKEVLPSSGKTIKKATVNPTPSQAKSVTPSASQKIVTPDSGKLLNKVTVNGDSDLVAGNIKKDVNIFGVTGTFDGEPVLNGTAKEYYSVSGSVGANNFIENEIHPAIKSIQKELDSNVIESSSNGVSHFVVKQLSTNRYVIGMDNYYSSGMTCYGSVVIAEMNNGDPIIGDAILVSSKATIEDGTLKDIIVVDSSHFIVIGVSKTAVVAVNFSVNGTVITRGTQTSLDTQHTLSGYSNAMGICILPNNEFAIAYGYVNYGKYLIIASYTATTVTVKIAKEFNFGSNYTGLSDSKILYLGNNTICILGFVNPYVYAQTYIYDGTTLSNVAINKRLDMPSDVYYDNNNLYPSFYYCTLLDSTHFLVNWQRGANKSEQYTVVYTVTSSDITTGTFFALLPNRPSSYYSSETVLAKLSNYEIVYITNGYPPSANDPTQFGTIKISNDFNTLTLGEYTSEYTSGKYVDTRRAAIGIDADKIVFAKKQGSYGLLLEVIKMGKYIKLSSAKVDGLLATNATEDVAGKVYEFIGG